MYNLHLLGILIFFCLIVESAAQAGVSEFSQRCSQSNGGALTVNGDAVYASTTTDDGSDVGGDGISVNLITCGGSDGDDELFDVNNLGVFYTVEGTDARLRVSACSNQTDFQNRVSVFSSCDSDSCLNSAASENHQDSNVADICPNANASIVEFQSTLGETYNILVQNENAGQSGNFSLAVEEMQPENVVCQQAMELEMDKTIAGTTAGVGVSSSSVESCNQNNTNSSSSSSSTTIGPGVWFYIPAESSDNSGDDNGNYQIIVGTCSMQRMNFWVYNADAGCDEELTCVEVEPQVDGNYSCEDGSPQSLVTWFSTKEEGYYVYMFGEEGTQFRIVFTRSLLSNGDSGVTKQSAVNFVVLGSWILALVLWIQM
eukprot:scaffold812_cov124-Cylindrotheca_fusiformis.AAC.5